MGGLKSLRFRIKSLGVKIARFLTSHFNRHAETLHHLIDAHPDAVHANDDLRRTVGHELHRGGGLVREGNVEDAVVEVRELGGVYLDVLLSVDVLGLLFGVADRSDGWGSDDDELEINHRA